MNFRDIYEEHARFVIFLGFACAIGLLMLIFARYDDYKWAKTPTIVCRGELINDYYEPSYQIRRAKGNCTYPETFVTVWDCGVHGRLLIDNKHFFRHAKSPATIYFKQIGDDYRIVNIKW